MKGWKARAVAVFLALLVCIAPASFALADDAETQELESQLEDLQRQAEKQQEETDRLDARIGTISEQLRVHAVSALNGTGLDALAAYFAPGKTICLLGSSGAGKSTLINTLAGETVMQTGAIREADAKGRHTTTHRQLIRLNSGVSIIDTPGMREIGMADADEGIDRTFSGILALESQCRFRNCRHETEPGCAVKAAIASGELSKERFELYKNLGKENADHRARKKEISKSVKAYKKSKSRTEE